MLVETGGSRPEEQKIKEVKKMKCPKCGKKQLDHDGQWKIFCNNCDTVWYEAGYI